METFDDSPGKILVLILIQLFQCQILLSHSEMLEEGAGNNNKIIINGISNAHNHRNVPCSMRYINYYNLKA